MLDRVQSETRNMRETPEVRLEAWLSYPSLLLRLDIAFEAWKFSEE